MQPIRISIAIAAAGLLSACAILQPPEKAGRHLLVRDLSGKLVMQFDYPSDELCARTSSSMRAIKMYKAGCDRASSAAALNGQATLRYNPPGVLVQAHYEDVAACRKQTVQLSSGVELILACAAK